MRWMINDRLWEILLRKLYFYWVLLRSSRTVRRHLIEASVACPGGWFSVLISYKVTSVTWQHFRPRLTHHTQMTFSNGHYNFSTHSPVWCHWRFSAHSPRWWWDVNIMVVVVYKCTLNLVSPAPLTSDWAMQSASVLSALPPHNWPGPLARPVWPHDCKHSKSPDWIRIRLSDTQVYSCTERNVRVKRQLFVFSTFKFSKNRRNLMMRANSFV